MATKDESDAKVKTDVPVVSSKAYTKYKFSEGEKVLCYHGPLIYEAKCLQNRHEEQTKHPEYFIHYFGWNKSYDEWVPESRVLKFNDANIQKQKDLYKSQKSELKNKREKRKTSMSEELDTASESESRCSSPVTVIEKVEKEPKNKPSVEKEPKIKPSPAVPGNTTPLPTPESPVDQSKKKKSRAEPVVEVEQDVPKVEVKVKIPDELKPRLVDDWELISRHRRLTNLPATVSVDQILDDYYASRASSKSMSPYKLQELSDAVTGFREFFDIMLGTQLLYKFERMQYANMLALFPGKPMSKIYGVIHLLRLFIKIGSVLAVSSLDEKSINLVLTHSNDFLKYLVKNASSLFSLLDYGVASCDYQRILNA